MACREGEGKEVCKEYREENWDYAASIILQRYVS